MHIYIYICMYIDKNMCVCAHTYVNIYVYRKQHTAVYTIIYIYIHTHIPRHRETPLRSLRNSASRTLDPALGLKVGVVEGPKPGAPE